MTGPCVLCGDETDFLVNEEWSCNEHAIDVIALVILSDAPALSIEQADSMATDLLASAMDSIAGSRPAPWAEPPC